MPGGEEDQRNGGGMDPVEILGVRHAVDFRAANVFGASAINHKAEVGVIAAEVVMSRQTSGAMTTGNARSENDFLADVDVVDIVADLDDLPGDITAGNMRKRNRVIGQAVADPKVEMIESAGVDADQNFVRMNVRLVHFRVVQDTWITMLVKDDRFHGRPPGEATP
jgi:hypothetical protein